MRRSRPTIQSVRRELVGDSIERKKLVDTLVRLVREEEREKTMKELRDLGPRYASPEAAR